MQVTQASSTFDLLTKFVQSSKKTHWLTRNLTIQQKTFFHNRVFHFLLHNFPIIKRYMEIDLEASREQLLRIRRNFVNAKDPNTVLLYNLAVANFNTFYPQKPLYPALPEKLSFLMRDCLRPVVYSENSDLKVSESCSEQSLKDYLCALALPYCYDSFIKSIRNFEKCGGKVILLPILPHNQRHEPCIRVHPLDEIAPVCHAGAIRSATMRVIASGIKRKLGLLEGKNRVRPQHGVENGHCSYDFRSIEGIGSAEFIEAFGIHRSDRFGSELLEKYQKDPTSFKNAKGENYKYFNELFNDKYYGHSSSSPSKIYITMCETGFTVLPYLLYQNLEGYDPDKEIVPSQIFKNVTVVFFSDYDWISNINISEQYLSLLDKMVDIESKKPKEDHKKLSELTDAERREVFWALTGLISPPRDLEEKLKHYYEDLADKSIWGQAKYQRVFQVEAFRVAYWKWSGAFQPVVTAP